MLDIRTFEELLAQPENDLVDFKLISYDFAKRKDEEDANFVKDILAFSNTIRETPAYIIAGVRLNGAQKELIGISGMLDDASFQQKAEQKVLPKPRFIAYLFAYQGMEFGIIEIPVHPHGRPLEATQKMKGCVPGKVYIRRGSQNAEADGSETIAVSDWQRRLIGVSAGPPAKNQYERPAGYIPRTVSPVDGDPLGALFREGISLREAASKKKRIALLGWGLSGKSTELKQLAYELAEEGQVFPFLVPLGNHVDEPIAGRIPDMENIPQAQLVVLLDGLDEVLPDQFEIARRRISQFVTDHPAATVVVSCRTNFYTTATDESGLSTLVNFDSYRLDGLQREVIEDYLDRTDPKNKTDFYKEVQHCQVDDLLVTPYYLVKLAQQFRESGKISDSKADLFEMEVRQLVRQEIANRYRSGHARFEKHLLGLFRRLAFIMEAKGSNELSTEELEELLPGHADYEQVINAGSIFYIGDPARQRWRFNHNNTQEFLAAQVLSGLTYKKIKKVIGIGPDFRRVKPSWVNTLSFLNSMLSPKSSLKKQLTRWLVRDNRSLVVMLEPEKIDPEVRYRTFREIFADYEKKGRKINRNIYRLENLAKFSESPEVFAYLLKKLAKVSSPVTTANALEIINFYPLKQYPEAQAAFKVFYEQALFGDDDSLHYSALVGYAANFQLTSGEFRAVYERYKDSDDTWIRYQLFRAIWLTDNQEALIDYVLVQARELLRDNLAFRQDRKKKDRLSNEYNEIAACLEGIRSAPALLRLFTGLETEFVSFAHSVTFGKVIEPVLGHAARFPKNKALANQINRIFLTNHSYVLHDGNLKKAFLAYYVRTGRRGELLAALYARGFKDFSTAHSIAQLADADFIHFLFAEFGAGRLNTDNRDTLLRYMQTTTNPLEAYFRQVFGLPAPAELPAKNYKKEMALTGARNLAALFDQDLYLAEVKLLFDKLGKTTITYDDTYAHAEPDYWSDTFCQVGRDALQLGPYHQSAVLEEVQNHIERYFARDKIEGIYDYLLRHADAMLTAEQQQELVAWCDARAEKIDFPQALHRQDPDNWELDQTTVMFSFFLRKLALDHYPEALYGAMVSFIKYEDQLIDIIPFTASVLGAEKVKDQVLANLKAGIANSRSLGDHLNYVEQQTIKAAAPLLLNYLYGLENSNHYQALKLYLQLDGKLPALKPVLTQAEGYFLDRLIDEFVKAADPYIEGFLQKRFVAEQEPARKLALARYLIRMQDEPALDHYLAFIRDSGRVPDDSSPRNPLYALRKPKFTERLLDLYKLAQNPHYYRDSFYDLRSISFSAMQQLAMAGANFPKFKKRVNAWIRVKERLPKARRGVLPPNLISDMHFFLESFGQEFYHRVDMLTLPEAVRLYGRIELNNKHKNK